MAGNMNPTSSMIHLDFRLASYSASSSSSHGLSKSRSKKSQANTHGHNRDFPLDPTKYPKLTPESLAEAGFFFSPAEDEEDDDTCQCFLCGLKLGGWDEGDDPFEEHVKRHNCPWAEFVCATKLNRRKGIQMTYDTPESLPTSAESCKFREQTYQQWWPHRKKSAWLPTVKTLAKAGFVFYSSSDSPDLVVCPSCDYAVEGWEATDDPWSVHYAKSPDCEFFVAQIGGSSKTAAASKAEKTTGKKSKRGTTAPKTTSAAPDPQAPSEDDADANLAQESQAALGRSTSGTAPRQTKPRATSRSKSKTRPPEESEQETAASDAEEVIAEKSTRARKATRARGGKNAEPVASEADSEAPEAASAAEGADTLEDEEARPVKGRRSRKKKGKAGSAPLEEVAPKPADTEANDAPAKQGKRTRGRKKKVVDGEVLGTGPSDSIGLGQAAGPSTRQRTTRSVSAKSAQSQQSGIDGDMDGGEQTQESDSDNAAGEFVASDGGDEEDEAEAVDPETTIRAPSPPSKKSTKSSKSAKSQASSKSSQKQPTEPDPPSTSQLDRFANVPPSSPFPTPRHNSQPSQTRRASPTDATPRPQSTLVSSKPSKSSPHIRLPRETLDKSVTEGAREARRVMEDLVLNSTSDQDLQGLSDEQQGMTLEELVRGEMKKRYESLKLEGEEMIRKWEEKGREARRRIESL